MIRIALTKGRLEEKAVELFNKAEYDAGELLDKGRKLLFKIKNADIEIVLAKAADVITYVEHGVCDIGITGKDIILENSSSKDYGKSFYEVLDLNFGKCRFALAGMQDKNFYEGYSQKIIATKYPNVTKKYFNEKGVDVEIVKIEGSVELAPILGLADAIVDIVETGSTLKENGLVIYEEIAQSSARVIVNKASIKLKKNEVDEFVGRIGQLC
jgi:ATP phosphoribosyltransferase